MSDSIAVLDFGSQTSQLIARRVREAQVYCELFPWDAPAETVLALQPRGFILSGGPASVYETGAPRIPDYVFASRLPVLGICYGMQALTHTLRGRVGPAKEREYGLAVIQTTRPNPLIPDGTHTVWMSHGDRIEYPPAGFDNLAYSDNSPVAVIGDLHRQYFGVQFHPEVNHTPNGREMLRAFVVDICGCRPDWTAQSIIQQSLEKVRSQAGDARVLSAVSGGVDSSVATALVQRAVGKQLSVVFVDTGLMREGERAQVEAAFRRSLGDNLVVVDASSMRTNGKRICQALHQKQPTLPLILVIDQNSDPNDNYGADTILVLPFTMQKLINRIRHLLPIHKQSARAAPSKPATIVREVEPDLFDEVERGLEVSLGLGREADQHVGRESDLGQGLATERDLGQVVLAGVAPVHPFQNGVRAGLHRQVQARADVVQTAHGVEQARIEVARVRGQEADAHLRQGRSDRGEQVREPETAIPIRKYVLAKQRQVLHAIRDVAVGLGQDARQRPGAFATLDVRYDAVGAVVVAAAHHGHECGYRELGALPIRGQAPCRHH